MIKIGILGDIGSGKSYVAKQFGFPVFDADVEVTKIYKKNRTCFNRLKNKIKSANRQLCFVKTAVPWPDKKANPFHSMRDHSRITCRRSYWVGHLNKKLRN